MVESYVKVIGSVTGAKTQNTEWFSSDLTTETTSEQFSASKFRITIGITAEKKVQVTLDSGSNWLYLNSGDAIKADSLYVFDVPVRQDSNFNMRTDETGGCTIAVCNVSEVSMEG